MTVARMNRSKLTLGWREADKLDMDISGWIERWADFTPDKTAILFGDEDLSYLELNERIRACARMLGGPLGVRHGGRVAFLGYKPPGAKHYGGIPDSLFPQPHRARVLRYEREGAVQTVMLRPALLDSLWPRTRPSGQ